MRFLFSSLPAHGHAYPLIPLALAARDAGHEVLFATGEPLHQSIKAFGLDVATAGITIFEGFVAAHGGPVDRSKLTLERTRQLQIETFGAVLPRAFFNDLRPLLDQVKPDLVIHEVGNTGAYFAAKQAGIPGVCHGFGRVVAEGAETSNDRLAAFGAEIGVPFTPGFLRGGGDPYLDIYPPSMQDPKFRTETNRIPLRPVPVDEPRALPGWLLERDKRRQLAFLTLGTGFGTARVFRTAIAGLVAAGVDVLAVTGSRVAADELGDLPENVHVEAWVSQAALLAHVDVVVHHGGSGTTLGALGAGLPQLVLPQGADQFINAHAVAETGAGDQILPAEFGPDTVEASVKRLLTDGAQRSRARAVATEIAAMPSPAATVPFLVDRARP